MIAIIMSSIALLLGIYAVWVNYQNTEAIKELVECFHDIPDIDTSDVEVHLKPKKQILKEDISYFFYKFSKRHRELRKQNEFLFKDL